MATTFKDVDKGYKKRLRALRKMAGPFHVSVGIQGKEADAGREGGKTNVQIATLHEFGWPQDDGSTIPERSFIRAGTDSNAV